MLPRFFYAYGYSYFCFIKSSLYQYLMEPDSLIVTGSRPGVGSLELRLYGTFLLYMNWLCWAAGTCFVFLPDLFNLVTFHILSTRFILSLWYHIHAAPSYNKHWQLITFFSFVSMGVWIIILGVMIPPQICI